MRKKKIRDWDDIPKPDLKIFKTVQLGTHETVLDLLESIKNNNMKFAEWNTPKRKGFKVLTTPTEVDLIALTLEELGFPTRGTYSDICDQAEHFGLELCPPEVGLQLRLQYFDQPADETLLIGMTPIKIVEKHTGIFRLIRNLGTPLLTFATPNAEKKLSYGTWNKRFVFVLPRK